MSGPKIVEFTRHARQRLAERFPAFVRACGGIGSAEARVALGVRATGKLHRTYWRSRTWSATATVPLDKGDPIEFIVPVRRRKALSIYDTTRLPR